MERMQIVLLLLIIGPLSVVCLYWDSTEGTTCKSQRDCENHQCCVNEKPGADTGLCVNRKRTGATCHNPRHTGFHHVSCPGPEAIVHPDLCPCSCGEFCAIGFNAQPDGHGGYYGTCTFG